MNQIRDPFRGYCWERRPWNTKASPATWEYTGYTRQRQEPDYEPLQLDYSTGLTAKDLVRKKRIGIIRKTKIKDSCSNAGVLSGIKEIFTKSSLLYC